MALGMTLGQYHVVGLECGLCGQKIDGPDPLGHRASSALLVILCGAAKYAVCPCCFRPVDELDWTKGYKQRWTRRVNKLKQSST